MSDDDRDPGMLPDSWFTGWQRRRYQLEHFLGTRIGALTQAVVLTLLGALLALAGAFVGKHWF